MIPRSRRAALLEVLAAERRVKALTLDCYRQWLPVARARVLPGLTAAADDQPPDPDAIAQTEADWEAILAAVFLPGLAAIVWEQLTADLAALGVTATDIRALIEAAARATRPGSAPAGTGTEVDIDATSTPAAARRDREAERARRAAEREAQRQQERAQERERRAQEREDERQAREDDRAAARAEREERARERAAAREREQQRRADEKAERERQAQERREREQGQEPTRAQQQRRERERRQAAEREQRRQAEERRAEQARAERERQAREREERQREEREAQQRRRDAERAAAEQAEQQRREAEARDAEERQADEDAERAEQEQQQAEQERAQRRDGEEPTPGTSSSNDGGDGDGGDGGGGDDEVDLTPRVVAAIPSAEQFVAGYLAQVRNRMVRTPDTAFRLIADELAEAVRLGESPQQQRDRVARVLDAENLETFGGRRAALVARTETCGALNAARLEAGRVLAEITGEQMQKAWLATIDSRTRDTHFAVDGQRVDLDAQFQLPNGVRMRWPGEPGAPAAEVCNCRCALMILAVDEELPAEDDRQTERGPGDATVRNREGTRQDEIDRRRDDDGIVRARDDPAGIGQINAAADAPPPERITAMRRFTAVLAHLGQLTDDGRLLDVGMDLRFRETPLPLRWQRQDVPAHEQAYTVGAITAISLAGTEVIAEGHLLDTPEAAEAAVQITAGVTNPSIDLADVDWEIRDQHGNQIDIDDEIDDDTKLVFTMTSAIVTAATLVSIPAFGTTSITLTDEDADDAAESVAAAALLAAATAPRFLPAARMFDDPGLSEPTPLHLTDDGRIIGHLAVFGVCHVGISDRCVTPPRSHAGYSHFHTSAVTTADGARLPVGRLTVGTGHAEHGLTAHAAAAHYDNTGTCWAYVRAGEDEIGIWVSGVLHPDATERQVREGLSAPLSGDWRSIGGHLELVAALSVNTPGFPVISGRDDAHGRVASLIASLSPRQARTPLTSGVLRAVARETARETVREYREAEARRARAAALITRHRKTEAAALIAAVRQRG